jgi:hypothetical protein
MEQNKNQLENDIDRAQDQQNVYESTSIFIFHHFFPFFSTIVNRLCSELNRLITELALERDILIDFQSKLDAAEYVNIENIVFLFQLFSIEIFSRMDRTKAIIERAHYNHQEVVLKEKEIYLNNQKQSLTKLRQRQEDWKVTQMKRARLSEIT